MSEAQPVTAVSLLCREEMFAVAVLAAPPEARHRGVRVTHVLHTGVPGLTVSVQRTGGVAGGVTEGGLRAGETEHQDGHEAQLIPECCARHDWRSLTALDCPPQLTISPQSARTSTEAAAASSPLLHPAVRTADNQT